MVYLIWAEDIRHGIAKNQQIPWKIKDDMIHFKKTTLNHVVVMGHATYKTIKRALSQRINVVLTNQDIEIDDVEVYSDFLQVLTDFKDQDIYIIGGKQIYDLYWDYADGLIISKINKDYDCDLIMNYSLDDFKLEEVVNYGDFEVEYYKRVS